MAKRNQYVKDYRLVESVNERGRIKTSYEYIGADYYYLAAPSAVKAARRRALVFGVLGWLGFLGALLPESGAMRTIWVSLPFAFAALPLGMLLDLALTTFFRKEPLEHRHADKLENRWPPVCLAAAALPAIALAGQLVRLLTGAAMKTGDLIFSLGAALSLVCALLCFRLRKSFAVRKG